MDSVLVGEMETRLLSSGFFFSAEHRDLIKQVFFMAKSSHAVLKTCH